MRYCPVLVVTLLATLCAAGPASAAPVEFRVSPETAPAAPDPDSDGIVMPPEAMEHPPKGAQKTGPAADTDDEDREDARDDSAAIPAKAAAAAPSTPDAGLPKSPDAGAAPVPEAAPLTPAAASIPLELPKESVAGIMKHWERRKAALAGRDFKTADAELEAIAQIRLDNGARNLFALSTALVQESKAAQSARDRDGAVRLADAAWRLSPDLPSASFQRMRAAFSRNKTDLVSVTGCFMDTLGSIWNDPPSLILAIANLLLILGAGFSLAFFAFILSMLIRNLPLLLHDFGHLFPDGAPRIPLLILGILILLLPAALGAGPLITAMFWAACAWQYSARREKALLLVSAALLSAVPFGIPYAASALDQGNGRAMTLYRALRDGEAAGAPGELLAMAQASKDPAELLAAGVISKRAGRFDEAEKFYLMASALDPKNPAPVMNLGNLHLIRDRFSEAIDAYNKALSLDPANATAMLNMSQVFFRQGEAEKGRAEREAAEKLDPEIGFRITSESPSINLMVVDAEPSNAAIFWRLATDGTPKRPLIVSSLEGWLTGGFRAYDAPYLFAAFVLILALLERFAKLLRPSILCQRCGRPACRRCAPIEMRSPLCAMCFRLYQTKEIVDPEIKTAMEFDALRRQRRMSNLRKAVSIVIPGSGFIVSGEPVLALISMLLVYPSLVFLATLGGPVPWRFVDMGGLVWSLGLLFAAISLALYLKSLSAVFRR